MIKYHPWKVFFPYINQYLSVFHQRIFRSFGEELRNEIDEQFSLHDQTHMEFDSGYPFLFIKYLSFDVYTSDGISKVDILFALGKRKNGFYHVFSPSSLPVNNVNELFDYLQKNKNIIFTNIIRDSLIKIDNKFLDKYRYLILPSYTSFVRDFNKKVFESKGRNLNIK